MVTLSTAYGLCSLVDDKGFLHVSDDEDYCALVTLGRNIVIRYRLADQKQLNSWSTIPQFTTGVVFNKETSTYYGIFNETVIKQWTKDDVNLDKVSKIKLKSPGHSILISDDVVVLFKSGGCCTVSYLKNKNNEPPTGFLPKDASISKAKIVKCDGVNSLILIVNQEKTHTCYSVPLDATFSIVAAAVTTLKLRRRGLQLLGSCFVPSAVGDGLVTLWSDGFLYSLPLPLSKDPSDAPLGTFVGVLRCVNLSGDVALTALSPQHIAVYGGDPAEEGAVLAVYHLNFSMVQASTSFKLLQKPPRVWAVHDRLIVGLGQRLLCVPYTLQSGRLVALVGSRPVGTVTEAQDIVAVLPTVQWDEEKQGKEHVRKKKAKKIATVENGESTDSCGLEDEINTLTSQGYSEAWICEAIITKLLETKQVDKLWWCLDHFVDVSERLTVRLIRFALSTPEAVFLMGRKACLVNGSPSKVAGKKTKTNSDNLNGISELTLDDPLPECPLEPKERAEFLNRVFRLPITHSAVVAELRAGLNIAECISLLQYLAYLLSAGKGDLQQPTINWSTTMIDAFYQQLVLGRNSECVESVLSLKQKVDEKISALNELKDLLPLINRLKKCKKLKPSVQSNSYAIQRVELY